MQSSHSHTQQQPNIDKIFTPKGSARMIASMGSMLLSLPASIVRISKSGILLHADQTTLETMACQASDYTSWLQSTPSPQLVLNCDELGTHFSVVGDFVWSDTNAGGLDLGFQFQEDDSAVASLLSSLS